MGAHGDGRRGGLEANGEKHDLSLGVFPGDAQGVEGGVDHSDVGSAALGPEQVGGRAGDPEHVAEGAQDHAGLFGDGDRALDHLQRRDADRTAGTV